MGTRDGYHWQPRSYERGYEEDQVRTAGPTGAADSAELRGIICVALSLLAGFNGATFMSNLIVFRTFLEGGWVMYPILATSVVALSIIVEKLTWWFVEARRREPAKVEEVLEALDKKEIMRAIQLAGSSEDAVLRVLWFGLSHWGVASMQGAFQVAAGIELERAGRYVVMLDTIVTLAPLLGLLGTVTGLMKAFFKLGGAELSESAIGGGIAEALIATACGLSIAATCLIFLNYFAAKVTKLRHELQMVCGKAEVFLMYREIDDSTGGFATSMPEATDPSSLMPPSMTSPEAPSI